VVFTSAAAPADRASRLRAHATLVVAGRYAVQLSPALAALRERHGIGRLIVEGGPTLNRALLADGLIDELFWTVAPKLAGGPGIGLFDGQAPVSRIAASLTLVSLFEFGGELFARYRVSRD
jgi:riboflavin biosynthesis pyrimidine reductase